MSKRKILNIINHIKFLSRIIHFQLNFRLFLVKKQKEPHKIINYYYNKYLKEKGVKNIKETSNLYFALEYLYLHLKKQIHIDELRNYVILRGGIFNGGTDTLQVRHLGQQYGYNILKGSEIYDNIKIKKSHYLLKNLHDPFNGYCKDKRNKKIDNIEWNKLKIDYDNKCVNCGSIEGNPLRWNKNKITILTQGHMNPTKKLTIDNTIPQCIICNQQYKNKAIFNKRGSVIKFNEHGF